MSMSRLLLAITCLLSTDVRLSAQDKANSAAIPICDLRDDFDGGHTLNWKPVRLAKDKVSLTKHKGKLTITAQPGTILRKLDTDGELKIGAPKNLFLVDCPVSYLTDFQVTTKIDGFFPEENWQQAGLLIHTDDDNYLKWVYEYSHLEKTIVNVLWETDGSSDMKYFDATEEATKAKSRWMRIVKRGKKYECSMSLDGKNFQVYETIEWGNGAPKMIGLVAKSGYNAEAKEIDVQFDSFEITAPVAEQDKPAAAARPNVIREEFDKRFSLNWQPVRLAENHVSLTKSAGQLTITTQAGSIHAGEKTNLAKNLFVLPQPFSDSQVCEVTTKLTGFAPTTHWQQAGLLFYTDDDNYLKCVYEYSSRGKVDLAILRETDGESQFEHYEPPEPEKAKQLWMRVVKRGGEYSFSISTDGKKFEEVGFAEWKRDPAKVGLIAKNGGNPRAAELDANFEFVQVRAVPAKQAEAGTP